MSDMVIDKKSRMEVSGNTLRVYIYLAVNPEKTVGVRAVQRALGFSSPSSALYHLEKLKDRGLIDKDAMGNYSVSKPVQGWVLRDFVFVRRQLIPRHFFYGITTTIAVLLLLAALRDFLSYPLVLLALAPSILSTVLFWFEGLIVWRSRPRAG